jgi:DNA-binding transcriptional regulator YiaG
VQAIDQLLAHHTYPQIVAQLNACGMRSGNGQTFTASIVARIQDRYRLRPRYDRLRKAWLLTGEEMATLLGISRSQVKVWRQHGLLRSHAYTAKPDWLYQHPGDHPPRKAQGVKLSQRRLVPEVMPEQTKEVQCEA